MGNRMEIQLREFRVEQVTYGDRKGQYDVMARFTHGRNTFNISLDEGLGEKLIEVCRGKIAQASQSALEELTLLAKKD